MRCVHFFYSIRIYTRQVMQRKLYVFCIYCMAMFLLIFLVLLFYLVYQNNFVGENSGSCTRHQSGNIRINIRYHIEQYQHPCQISFKSPSAAAAAVTSIFVNSISFPSDSRLTITANTDSNKSICFHKILI